MTDKTTEALKLAEEALSFYVEDFDCAADVIALAAIREALAEQSLGEYHGKLMREVCNKVITKTLAEPEKQEPVFWYRPINEEIYEGPVHNDSVCGKMWRDEKPGEWLPLYAAPVDDKAIRALKLVYDNSTSHDWPECIWNAIVDALYEEHRKTMATCAAAIRSRGEK